jgi:hypothetical protein
MTYEMECREHPRPHRFLLEAAAADFTGEAPCDLCGKPCRQNFSRKSLSLGGGPTVRARRYIPGKRSQND